MIGNSPIFKRRLHKLIESKKRSKNKRKSKVPRVPKRYRGEPPQHHSDLFTDENPRGTVKGLRFRNDKDARESVRKLKKLYNSRKISYAHMRQIGLTMEQRSRYHAHPTKGIKDGNKVWKLFNRSFKK